MTVPVRVFDTAVGDRVLAAADIVALNPAFTGGSIDNMPIGGTTPAAVTGTTVTGSTLVTSGLVQVSVATGIVASTTQSRAGATALTKAVNVVATVANAADAVRLPALTPGQYADVYNNGANSASVFPNGASDTIDGGSGGASVALANAKRCRYICVSANTIISAQLGAVSA